MEGRDGKMKGKGMKKITIKEMNDKEKLEEYKRKERRGGRVEGREGRMKGK